MLPVSPVWAGWRELAALGSRIGGGGEPCGRVRYAPPITGDTAAKAANM